MPDSLLPDATATPGMEHTPHLALDGFTGPLDQLLALARAHQVDLANLPVADLVAQLLAALRDAPATTPLARKADWVVMAAWLLQLRSRLLLPPGAPDHQAATAEAHTLRHRLATLEAMQALAAWMDRRPRLGRDAFPRGQPEFLGITVDAAPALDVIEFLWASLALFDADLPALATTPTYQPRSAPLHTVPEARARILQRLAEAPAGLTLAQLLPPPEPACPPATPRHRSAWTSTFVAGLELARQGEVALHQAGALQPIHVIPQPASPSPEP